MIFDFHQPFPDIQGIELYAELDVLTSTNGSPQNQINKNNGIQHNVGKDFIRTTSPWTRKALKKMEDIR